MKFRELFCFHKSVKLIEKYKSEPRAPDGWAESLALFIAKIEWTTGKWRCDRCGKVFVKRLPTQTMFTTEEFGRFHGLM